MDSQKDKSLKKYNTFGIEAKAKFFCEITTTEQLQWLLVQSEWKKIPKLFLGGGSNMLFVSDYEGLVVKISIPGYQIVETKNFSLEEDSVLVKVGAGEHWHDFVLWSLEQGFGGIENLSLIPGTVGAAPVQNIGAYGVELSDVFHSLQAIEITTGRSKIFTKDDMELRLKKASELYFMLFCNSLCVPINMSTLPDSTCLMTSFCSFAVLKRDNTSIAIGQFAKRSLKFS